MNSVSEPLLPTKLLIPIERHAVIPRPRLMDRLNQGQAGNVTLLTAPAGFGKTTLVTTWLTTRAAALQHAAAWFAIDENDNLFPRFFTYFMAAVQTIHPTFAQALLAGLQLSPPPAAAAILQVLLQELAALEQPLVLVLDDYHQITNDAIHDLLRRLIEYLPATLHLVITSRDEPPFPLARLRVRGHLIDIRADDLRFTTDEAAAFFQQTLAMPLDQATVATLGKRTEGWIAGLQLAGLSLRNVTDIEHFLTDFGGTNRHIAEYLLEEVLEHQPPAMQKFLLQTSILDRFCAELCDALVEAKDWGLEIGERRLETNRKANQSPIATLQSQTLLDQIEKADLFVTPLDAHRRWYRYHHLFAQLLREQLRRLHGQAQVNELHRRAAGWFAHQGLIEEAIDHAVQGEHFAEAARLLATVPLDQLWEQGSASPLKAWGQRIPTAALRQHPRALIALAVAHQSAGDIDQFKAFLALCDGIESVRGEYALFKGIQLRSEGDFGGSLHLAQEAGEYLADEEPALHALALMQIAANLVRQGEWPLVERSLNRARMLLDQADGASLNLHLQVIQIQAATALMQANYAEAHRFYHEGRTLAEQATTGTPPLVGFMYAGLGQVHYEWNELTEAAANYTQARAWWERSGIFAILMLTLVGEIALLCQQGDAEAAAPYLEAYGTYGRHGHYPYMIQLTESTLAAFHLRLGQLEEAVRWANASGFQLTDQPDAAYHSFYQVLAAVRLAEYRALGQRGDLPQLMELLDYLFHYAQTTHYQRDTILILILRALALDLQGEQTAARRSLTEAVTLAQSCRFMRAFLDREPALIPLLAQLDHPYAQRLAQLMHQELPAQGEAAPALLDLTPREREVLRAIMAGLSNQEIEEKLVISRNTVRTHIKNLYSKLAVTSRTQAVKKARELGIV
ncbi:MAG: LuxR C-terminal-related transcriptional regulator [Caldilineaceae bacterium]